MSGHFTPVLIIDEYLNINPESLNVRRSEPFGSVHYNNQLVRGVPYLDPSYSGGGFGPSRRVWSPLLSRKIRVSGTITLGVEQEWVKTQKYTNRRGDDLIFVKLPSLD